MLDFDAAHLDLRVADFALSWRGQHGDLIRDYEEWSPLEPVEWAVRHFWRANLDTIIPTL